MDLLFIPLQVRELLAAKLPIWQTSCTQPTRLPERALALVKLTANNLSGGTPIPANDALPGSKVLEELSELGPNHVSPWGGLVNRPFILGAPISLFTARIQMAAPKLLM